MSERERESERHGDRDRDRNRNRNRNDDLEILLTNDDGIDSPGLRALYDELSALGTVTTVAPATDQSAIGRALSSDVDVEEHDLGYAVHGTPADCVVAGLSELCPTDPDLVVSGCNKGANLGEYVLGRSGTVSAAVEAAFFDVPAIAASMYVPTGDLAFTDVQTTPEDYVLAADATRYLAERGLEFGVFETVAYLNVNAPMPDGATDSVDLAPLELTRPSKRYEMDASRHETGVTLHDRVWEEMDPDVIPDPEGTDRRAVAEGRISVSPLTAPHTVADPDSLSELVASYGRLEERSRPEF
ncbi:5'/3'-nucleotidase SurE [Natronosalvus caseinilyticus]|uniref:5'/3'-nucleotidase SurE n=1 Tax=Natronosalvus caseinilyticus TaxID=2953747 RepID=UPI0028AAD353|nr:5'/3'-nucleotidase SurE [Natronosalvus caseinilyticus]